MNRTRIFSCVDSDGIKHSVRMVDTFGNDVERFNFIDAALGTDEWTEEGPSAVVDWGDCSKWPE